MVAAHTSSCQATAPTCTTTSRTGLSVSRDGQNASEDATLAARNALVNVIDYLGYKRGLSCQRGYGLCGVVADLKLSELVDRAKLRRLGLSAPRISLCRPVQEAFSSDRAPMTKALIATRQSQGAKRRL